MKNYTKETLNALLDDEYSATQQAELLSRIASNRVANEELCQLRSIKQLVKTAYQETPEADHNAFARRIRPDWMPMLAVASLVFVVALIALVTSVNPQPESAIAGRVAILDPDGRAERPALSENSETRIVLHLLEADMQVAAELLDEVETLLTDYRNSGERLRVEIVAHSHGLALLRQSLSEHKERISQMSEEYPNLAFVACLNTVKRLRVEQGIEVTLLPEAGTTESGVAHVVQRQKEGWAYIKV